MAKLTVQSEGYPTKLNILLVNLLGQLSYDEAEVIQKSFDLMIKSNPRSLRLRKAIRSLQASV